MRIPRFYQSIDGQVDEEQTLSAINHRHAIQVLRLKENDQIILFDGKEGEYLAQISVAEKRESRVRLVSFSDVSRESPLKTTLVLSTIKSDKMDFAIQKSVELGVSKIQPMISHRSVIKIKADRLQKKMLHWQAVIVGACEQSGRTAIPSLFEPLSLKDCLEKHKNDFCIGMLPTITKKFVDLDHDTDKEIALFIGPEGGFTDDEEALMQSYKINTVNVGSRTLRAETAVITGLSACQQKWGDL